MSKFKKLLTGLEKRYIFSSIMSPVVMIGEVVMEVVIPFIMAKIIDDGIGGNGGDGDLQFVIRYGLIMIGLACISLLCGVLGTFCSTYGAQGFACTLRKRLFTKIQGFSFSNIDKFSTASLVTRLTTDINMAQNVYRMLIQMCVRSPFMLIAGTIMAFRINPKMAVLFLIAIPIIAIGILIISSIAHPRFEKMMKKFDGLNAAIQENLVGIRIVKAYVRGEYEEEKFRKAADDVRTAQVKAEKVIIFSMPLMTLVMYVSMIAVMWFGGKMVVGRQMLSGELISFFTYVTQILSSLMMLGMVFVSIIMVKASNKRIIEVLDEVPDITNPENPVMTVKDGSVEFDNVSFSYNKKADNCVLRDINLKIKSGQVVGIIGGTGSSKTTLVSLLPRLYDVYSGSVKIGGTDVRD